MSCKTPYSNIVDVYQFMDQMHPNEKGAFPYHVLKYFADIMTFWTLNRDRGLKLCNCQRTL